MVCLTGSIVIVELSGAGNLDAVYIDGNSTGFFGGRGRGRYTVRFLGWNNNLPPTAVACASTGLYVLIKHGSYVDQDGVIIIALDGVSYQGVHINTIHPRLGFKSFTNFFFIQDIQGFFIIQRAISKIKNGWYGVNLHSDEFVYVWCISSNYGVGTKKSCFKKQEKES